MRQENRSLMLRVLNASYDKNPYYLVILSGSKHCDMGGAR